MSELPVGWRRLPLGEIAKLGSGGTPSSGHPDYYNGSIPWAVIGDLNDGLVSHTEKSVTQLGIDNSSSKVVPEGTLLIAMYGSIGKLGITTQAMAMNQAIAFIFPREDVVTRDFLFYFLMSQREFLLRSGKGATQQNISQTILKAWDVPVPPLGEQKRIVEILEEQLSRLDVGLASLNRIERKVLQIARASRRDLIADSLTMSGSEQGTFGDYFKPKYGKALPKEKRSSDGRYPVVGSAGVMARTNEVLSEGPTIVIGRKGNVGQVEYFEEGCYPIDTTYYIQVTDGWDLQFLEFLLDSLELKNLDSSTATPSLRREDLESVPLVKPEIETQKILLNKLMMMSEGLSSIEEILNQAKLNASSLRRSLLNAAFIGQLTKEPANV